MSKARKYGFQRPYIPNTRADMRYRRKVYQRGREIGERAEEKSRERREERVKVDERLT